MSTKSKLSTRLRVFIIVSIILHVVVGVSTVVPYLVKRHLEEQRLLQEQEARKLARKKAEMELEKATREVAREKVVEALKTDAYDLLSENLDLEEFEELWDDLLELMEIDIEELVQQMDGMNFDISAADLEAMMDELRGKELEILLKMLDDAVKKAIAAKILDQLQQSVPAFEKQVIKALENHGTKARDQVAKVLKQEEKRRKKERGETEKKLAAAEKQVKAARAATRAANESVTRARQEVKKKRSATTAASEALADAIGSLQKAKTQTERLRGEADNIRKSTEGVPASDRKADLASASKARDNAEESVRKATAALGDASRNPAIASSKKPKDALTKALAGTKGILSNELRKVSDAFRQNDAVAVADRSAEAARAIGSLIKNLEKARGELGSDLGTLNPAAEKNIAAAGKALQEAGKGVENAGKRLHEAAHQAHVAAESEIGKAVTGTQKKLQNVVRASIEETGKALDQELESKKGSSKKGAPKSSFSAAPDALAKQRIDGRLKAAQEHSGQADKDLSEIEGEISGHRKKLASAGKTFAERASKAVAGATASGSAARKEADAFLEKTLRENVAEQFRKRTERLAAAALKQKKIADDPSFARKVGQMAVDALLKGSSSALKKGSFDALSAKTAQAFGGKGAHGGAKNSAAGQGNQQNAADAKLAKAVSKGLADQARAGISSALAAGQKQLKLPSPGAFGGESQIGFKLKNAIENIGRPVEGNSKDATLIDLSRDLRSIGLARKSGTRRLRLFKGRENIDKRYRERMAEVIEDREIDELILNAPQLANEVSASQSKMGKKRNAFILVSHEKEATTLDGAETKEETPPERKLYQPRFKTFAYGGAPLALDPPTIDGDLADWESVEEFKLRGVRKKAYWPGKVPPAWENNRYMMVQWNQKGFYFACRVVDRRNNVRAGAGDFWVNDSLEFFFDFANKRPEKRTKETQQFWFWPLGSRLGPAVLGGEASLQFSGRIFKTGSNPRQPRMAVKRTQNPRGYHMEIFLPVEVFRRPDLKPGRIIAFNFSINNGEELYFRWTANLGRNISVTPSLWGDLALLGTDAQIAYVKPGTEDPLTVIVPGEPVGARIKDVDMNLDREKKDKIEVTFSTENGDTLTGFFEETGEDTGLFAGSIDTELLLLQGEDRFSDKVLQVTGGELVEIIYLDQARRYGERNFEVKQKLPVGLPMLQF